MRGMSGLLAGFILLGVNAAGATTVRISRDEVNRQNTYTAYIMERGYQQWTNEEYLELECTPDGTATIAWHVGGHYGGDYVIGRINIRYRFDTGPVSEIEIDDLFSDLPKFYRMLQSHKRLYMVIGEAKASSSFDISDFNLKAGSKSAIGKQCARAFAPTPSGSSSPAVPAQ